MSWGFPDRKELAWHTELSVEECRKRLGESLDMGWFSLEDIKAFFFPTLVKAREVVGGKVDGDGFRLENRLSLSPFYAILAGKMQADPVGKGTAISARFTVNPYSMVLNVFVLAVLASLGISLGMMVISLVTHTASGHSNSYFGIRVVSSMFLLIAVYTVLREWLGKREKASLTSFLEKTLEAEQVTR